jgi:hypothetical protein
LRATPALLLGALEDRVQHDLRLLDGAVREPALQQPLLPALDHLRRDVLERGVGAELAEQVEARL